MPTLIRVHPACTPCLYTLPLTPGRLNVAVSHADILIKALALMYPTYMIGGVLILFSLIVCCMCMCCPDTLEGTLFEGQEA